MLKTSYENTSGSSSRLKDQPAGERPRERLVERGAQALSAAELVAILVRSGLRGLNALDIGKQLVPQVRKKRPRNFFTVQTVIAPSLAKFRKAIPTIVAREKTNLGNVSSPTSAKKSWTWKFPPSLNRIRFARIGLTKC
jgi:DNA repair protein RadC